MSELKFIPTFPLQLVASTVLNSSTIYANVLLTVGATALIEPVADVLSGRKINSAVFQLRPYATTAVVGIGSVLSFSSYAVVNVVHTNIFARNITDVNGTNTKELDSAGMVYLYIMCAGITIYHLRSLIELAKIGFHKDWVGSFLNAMHTLRDLLRLPECFDCSILSRVLSGLSPDEREKFILTLEEKIEEMEKMPEYKFVEFVENNDKSFEGRQKNDLFGLKTYRNSDDFNPDEDILEDDLPVKTSCFNAIGSKCYKLYSTVTFWRSAEENNELVNINSNIKVCVAILNLFK